MTLRAIDVGHLERVVAADQAAPQLAWLAVADLVVDETYQRAITPAGWKSIQRIADNFSWQRFGPVLVAVVPADQAAPQLAWLAVADLVVDEDYQRAITGAGWKSIQRIADNFSWQRFGPVLVAPLAGGKFGIVDGQHRCHAAALCGFEAVPAMIVPMTAQDQAKAFSWVNGAVLKVTPHALLKAAIAGGDPVAVAAKAAIEAAGCVWAMYNPTASHRKPGTVYAPGWPRKMVAAGQGAAMVRALAAMREFDREGRAELWSDIVMVPWVMAVAGAPAGADLVGVLRAVRPFKVLERASQSMEKGSGAARAARLWGRMLAESVVGA